MSTSVQEILDRMKAQKRTGPKIKISPRRAGMGTAYSTRVSPIKSPEVAPKAGTSENISTGCGTRKVKGGEGARGMDTKDIEKFINEKAPREIKDKLAPCKSLVLNCATPSTVPCRSQACLLRV